MSNIFISHSSREEELAKYFANWLESSIPGIKCFCSSRPTDLPPGKDWLKEIFNKATTANLCLLMLSPDSINNNWLHFESGMVFGAGITNTTIPTIYGGMNSDEIPPTVRHLQTLKLDEANSFNAFISAQFLSGGNPSPVQDHQYFLKQMNSSILRLLKFGKFGLLAHQNLHTENITNIKLLDNNKASIKLDRKDQSGNLVAVRTMIIPRRLGHIQHWKFGIELLDGNSNRVFHFHSGCHAGLTTWTLYFNTDKFTVPINASAHLETEKPSSLQLWLSPDGHYASCVGIDSDNQRIIIKNDRGADSWRLIHNLWTDILIKGWADGQAFQIDIENLEVDRIR